MKASEAIVRESDYYWGTVRIPFHGTPCCNKCPAMETIYGKRNRCPFTGEVIFQPEFIGFDCPIEWQQADENKQT